MRHSLCRGAGEVAEAAAQASRAGREPAAVTGALGYTGKYIARRLLDAGVPVTTLTGRAHRPNPFGSELTIAPLVFDDHARLTYALRGTRVLYNTYWIRFPFGRATYEQAVENTRALLRAAREAGVERIVHISIANASEASTFPYFRHKALVERDIRECGLSYAIVRPTVIFGADGILINNIAWLLRRLPVFLIPGSGHYRLQPVHVDDVAEIAVSAGERDDNLLLDAAGPEIYRFEDLVRLIARTVGSKAKVVHAPPGISLLLARLAGLAVRDVILTHDELKGLMADLLVSSEPPAASTCLSEWLAANATSLGTSYESELARHYRP